jgi:hypothetical protein
MGYINNTKIIQTESETMSESIVNYDSSVSSMCVIHVKAHSRGYVSKPKLLLYNHELWI